MNIFILNILIFLCNSASRFLLSMLLILFPFCRQYKPEYKLETYLKIARLYLEDADPVQAEAYINRASLLQTDSNNLELQIHYKVGKTHDIYIFVFFHLQNPFKLCLFVNTFLC